MELRQLSIAYDRDALNVLLRACNLRLEEELSYLCGLFEQDVLLACGGVKGNTIRCLAVDPAHQGQQLLNTLLSHLYTRLRRSGVNEVFLFSKPANKEIFQSLGFGCLAQVAQAALFTSKPAGVAEYLAGIPAPLPGQRAGAVVLNANPFTLGHRHLVEQAAQAVDVLYVFVVQEDQSQFPFAVRLRLVEEGVRGIQNTQVYPSGPYMISAATFPTYFLKDASEAARIHAALDCTLFATRIAPPLGISTRFVGSEPLDPLTALYNEAMQTIFPSHGLTLHIFPRIQQEGAAISASRVRALLAAHDFSALAHLVPKSTLQYLQNQNGGAYTHE